MVRSSAISPMLISIHPPRVGWDLLSTLGGFIYGYFNPPTPCGVGLADARADFKRQAKISIHPPRVGWDATATTYATFPSISIHPPRVGWDFGTAIALFRWFISIHPPRVGWDVIFWVIKRMGGISIHPPRVGWDTTVPHELVNHTNFNPPTPCGVGHKL